MTRFSDVDSEAFDVVILLFSTVGQVVVPEHDEATLRQMLEYIYTNRVKDMPGLSADEVIKLLALANGGFALM